MSIEMLPTQEKISNFNLVDYLGIGASIIILMVFSIFVIHWMFKKEHKNFQTAIIHVFAVPIVFALSSCTLDHYSQEPKLHPPLPAPIEKVDIDLNVDTIDGKPRVSMSWEDSQKFRVWLADIKRYTLESKLILCYYRKELNEERCKPKEK